MTEATTWIIYDLTRDLKLGPIDDYHQAEMLVEALYTTGYQGELVIHSSEDWPRYYRSLLPYAGEFQVN